MVRIWGDVHATLDGTTYTRLPCIQGGEPGPIVIFSMKRSNCRPDVPTAMDLGHGGDLYRIELYRSIAVPPRAREKVGDILPPAKGMIEWAARSERDLAWASYKESKEAVFGISVFVEQYKLPSRPARREESLCSRRMLDRPTFSLG